MTTASAASPTDADADAAETVTMTASAAAPTDAAADAPETVTTTASAASPTDAAADAAAMMTPSAVRPTDVAADAGAAAVAPELSASLRPTPEDNIVILHLMKETVTRSCAVTCIGAHKENLLKSKNYRYPL